MKPDENTVGNEPAANELASEMDDAWDLYELEVENPDLSPEACRCILRQLRAHRKEHSR